MGFCSYFTASELKNISENNHFGEIVKIMMITKSGSEGIDLKILDLFILLNLIGILFV